MMWRGCFVHLADLEAGLPAAYAPVARFGRGHHVPTDSRKALLLSLHREPGGNQASQGSQRGGLSSCLSDHQSLAALARASTSEKNRLAAVTSKFLTDEHF